MNDKGVSIGTFINLSLTFAISVFTNPEIEAIKGWTFIIYGIFCIMAAIFIMIYMKETKGLNEVQLQKLYRTDCT
jgi:hypothetical protein